MSALLPQAWTPGMAAETALWEEVKVLDGGSISGWWLHLSVWFVLQAGATRSSNTPAAAALQAQSLLPSLFVSLGVQGIETKRWWLPTLGPEPLGKKTRLCL